MEYIDIIKLIHQDVKDIKEDMQYVKTTNAVQNQQLSEHMRRTQNVEDRVQKLEYLKWLIFGLATISGVVGKIMGVY